jgi:uncharacterized membrane protein
MVITVLFLLCIGAGIVGGVFFAFSTFVMKALAQLPASQGVAAMQRISVVVINPLFMGAFMGTALLAVVCMVLAVLDWGAPGSILRFNSGALYLAGSFLVTVAFNVPRNERLAGMDPASSQAAAYWQVYLREWSLWNHVRTVASIASAAGSAWALAA